MASQLAHLILPAATAAAALVLTLLGIVINIRETAKYHHASDKVLKRYSLVARLLGWILVLTAGCIVFSLFTLLGAPRTWYPLMLVAFFAAIGGMIISAFLLLSTLK